VLEEWRDSPVVVTGGAGFFGREVVNVVREAGCEEVFVPRSAEYDLTRETDVDRMYREVRPGLVIHLAARVGGIGANQANPGSFFYANLLMGAHMVEYARKYGAGKFVGVGTVCSYPKFAPTPFREDSIWDGYPEETNAPYGLAKKMVLVQIQSYRRQYGMRGIYLIPVNLYGPGDNFDLQTSHVIPALIRKCEEARSSGADHVDLWGTGSPTREFLYVEDAARGVVLAADRYEGDEPVNLGTGSEVPIRGLAETIARLTGFEGELRWDSSRPDGQPRRRLDVSRAKERFGFEARMPLEEGIRRTIDWYRKQCGAEAKGT